MELAKDIFTLVSTIVALSVFVKGLIEFVHANAIRRYEKFHQMSVRFDESEEIQKVCRVLHSSSNSTDSLTKQDKEVFICFMEEIGFMINSGIMKRDIALYTFGYYGRMALENEGFWRGLNKNEPFYSHFVDFCQLAKGYQPTADAHKHKLVY